VTSSEKKAWAGTYEGGEILSPQTRPNVLGPDLRPQSGCFTESSR
jgi:hypothetical protein